jgi:hypothetical protein
MFRLTLTPEQQAEAERIAEILMESASQFMHSEKMN